MGSAVRYAGRVRFRANAIRQELLARAAGRADLIALGSGDPDLPTPPHVVEAGRRALAEGATHYTNPLGLPALRQAIARSIGGHGRAGVCGQRGGGDAGAQEAVFAAMLAFVEPCEEVLLPVPGYTAYDQAVEMAGLLVRLRGRNTNPDAEEAK